MGVTAWPMSRGALSAWVAVALCSGCGGGAPGEQSVPDEAPMVLGSPSVKVVTGADTVEVFSPTVFAYFAADAADDEPSALDVELARAAQETLSLATPLLRTMDVRVSAVVDLPRALVPMEADAQGGPSLVEGSLGYLLVHPRGAVRRLDRTTTGASLVCAAAALFEVAPPPEFGRNCGGGF